MPEAIDLAGVVIQRDHEMLLLHRSPPDTQQWEMPGGKIELGEDAPTAALRKIKEELGVDIELGTELGYAKFDVNGRLHQCHWLIGMVDGNQKPQIAEPIFDKLEYFDLTSLLGLQRLSPNMACFVQALITEEIVL